MILKNAIKCNICGDIIESKHRNDFVTCKCGSCSVDGGHDYLRRGFSSKACYTELAEISQPTLCQNEDSANEQCYKGKLEECPK